MSSVGLLFVGAVLFMNGLLFLGKADAKGVAVFNLADRDSVLSDRHREDAG
jgi:hypothetical protein